MIPEGRPTNQNAPFRAKQSDLDSVSSSLTQERILAFMQLFMSEKKNENLCTYVIISVSTVPLKTIRLRISDAQPKSL